MQRSFFRLEYFLLSLGLPWILCGACWEFYNVAWGTGAWLGEFSLTWFIFFSVFVLICSALLIGSEIAIWKPETFSSVSEKFISFRKRMGTVRWLPAIIALLFPVYFLQYTAGGVIFQGNYMRSLIWALVVFVFASFITNDDSLIGWKQFLAALLLTSSEFVIAVELIEVSNYPFSLGWSEGNRLWDYSVLFGRDLYLYPADREIPVLLDFGRQFVGGLPFLFPGVTIGVERLWVALTLIIPYLLLGLAAFRASFKEKTLWLAAALWTFLFLRQGPIHPPLVLSAALVALAWRMPFWVVLPAVFGAGYFASASRTSWIFAPAIWIVMLEFAGASFAERGNTRKIWTRAIILGLAGILGGFIFPTYIQPQLLGYFPSAAPVVTYVAPADPVPPAPVETAPPPATNSPLLNMIINLLTTQPLLWYRLLPNSTYASGILIALVIAITPLTVMLVYLSVKNIWQITRLQKLAILLPLLVFLAIGLIASAKIGGGGDLHNMDMFLITLMFAGMLAWYNGGREWLQNSGAIPGTMKTVIVLFFIVPALPYLRELYPYNMGNAAPRLVKLADAPNEKALDMLPNSEQVNVALDTIREEVTLAKAKGEILFIDQRQLLTFGYIQDVPFVPEYEKKVLMNEALSSNTNYFSRFYKDLAGQRFALIISEPLRLPDKGSAYEFGEENDAWVTYVAAPILCYYQEKTTLKEVGVQMLVPREAPADCPAALP
jgi:hypothetical protein